MNENICSPDTILQKNIYSNINNIKKGNKKVPNELFTIPTYEQYNDIIKYNYNVQQLKKMCKHYNQRQSGNKNNLMFRIFNYLKLSFSFLNANVQS